MVKELVSHDWECSDGSVFNNERAALMHEYDLMYDKAIDREGRFIFPINAYKILVINNKEELELFKNCYKYKEWHFYFVKNKDLEKSFPFILIELVNKRQYIFYHIDEYIARINDTAKGIEEIALKINQELTQQK